MLRTSSSVKVSCAARRRKGRLMEPISIFLGGFSGILGIIVGILVSQSAKEELKGYRHAFRLLRDYLFLLAAGLFLFQAGVLVLLVGLLMLSVVLKEFSHEDTSKVIIVLHVMLLIMTAHTVLFPTMAALLLVIGVMEAGWWAANDKGALNGALWRRALRDHVLYAVLPLANIIFLL